MAPVASHRAHSGAEFSGHGIAGHIRYSIRAAQEARITDPTFITLGEEVRACTIVKDKRK